MAGQHIFSTKRWGRNQLPAHLEAQPSSPQHQSPHPLWQQLQVHLLEKKFLGRQKTSLLSLRFPRLLHCQKKKKMKTKRKPWDSASPEPSQPSQPQQPLHFSRFLPSNTDNLTNWSPQVSASSTIPPWAKSSLLWRICHNQTPSAAHVMQMTMVMAREEEEWPLMQPISLPHAIPPKSLVKILCT